MKNSIIVLALSLASSSAFATVCTVEKYERYLNNEKTVEGKLNNATLSFEKTRQPEVFVTTKMPGQKDQSFLLTQYPDQDYLFAMNRVEETEEFKASVIFQANEAKQFVFTVKLEVKGEEEEMTSKTVFSGTCHE